MKNILVEGRAGLCMLAVLPLAVLDKLWMPTAVGSYLVVARLCRKTRACHVIIFV